MTQLIFPVQRLLPLTSVAAAVLVALAGAAFAPAQASSHREALSITIKPKLNGSSGAAEAAPRR